MGLVNGWPTSCLAEWREKNGKTQQWVADKVLCNRQQLSEWENYKCLPSRIFDLRLQKITNNAVSSDKLAKDKKIHDKFYK